MVLITLHIHKTQNPIFYVFSIVKSVKTISLSLLLAMVTLPAFSQVEEGRVAFGPEPVFATKGVQLYPNPATEYLIVKLNSPNAHNVKLAMHSVIGNVLDFEREQIDEFEVRLQIKELPSGYYFLSINDEESGFKASYKFLKR